MNFIQDSDEENGEKYKETEIEIGLIYQLFDGTEVNGYEILFIDDALSKASLSTEILDKIIEEIWEWERVPENKETYVRFSENLSSILNFGKVQKKMLAGQNIVEKVYSEKDLAEVAQEVINYVEERSVESEARNNMMTTTKSTSEKNVQAKHSIIGISSFFCGFSVGKDSNGKIWINPVTGPPFNRINSSDLHAMNVVSDASNMPMINFIMNKPESISCLQNNTLTQLVYTQKESGTIGYKIEPLIIEYKNENKKTGDNFENGKPVYADCGRVTVTHANELLKLFVVRIFIIKTVLLIYQKYLHLFN